MAISLKELKTLLCYGVFVMINSGHTANYQNVLFTCMYPYFLGVSSYFTCIVWILIVYNKAMLSYFISMRIWLYFACTASLYMYKMGYSIGTCSYLNWERLSFNLTKMEHFQTLSNHFRLVW